MDNAFVTLELTTERKQNIMSHGDFVFNLSCVLQQRNSFPSIPALRFTENGIYIVGFTILILVSFVSSLFSTYQSDAT